MINKAYNTPEKIVAYLKEVRDELKRDMSRANGLFGDSLRQIADNQLDLLDAVIDQIESLARPECRTGCC